MWGMVKVSFDFGRMVKEKQRRGELYAERTQVQRPWGRSIPEHSEEQRADQNSWRVAGERRTTGQRPKGQARPMKELAVL